MITKSITRICTSSIVAIFTASAALADQEMEMFDLNTAYGLAEPPTDCYNSEGKLVRYIGAPMELLLQRQQFLGFSSSIEATGEPVVVYDADLLPLTPKEFQTHLYYHECYHHEAGHLSQAPSSTEELIKWELEADCEAVKGLVNNKSYGRNEIDIIKDAQRVFLRVSIISPEQVKMRQENIESCFQEVLQP